MTDRTARPRDTPRTRPAKAPLSREAVIAAALRLVDETGTGAVTMRRVAQALDTGPASLYVYVADRDELMAEVYDLALAGVRLPGPADGDWRAQLELLVDRAITTLGGHDGIALVAITRAPTGPNALRLLEASMTLLRAGGIDDSLCPWAADLLDQFVTSSALELAARLRHQRVLAATGDSADATEAAMSAAAGSELDAAYGNLSPDTHPTITALLPAMTTAGRDSHGHATWKLGVIIDGLLLHHRRR
ncbi:TetR/AcrR family transcriptional regulator [Actinoplanes couchii]|uniref:TetR family transcriptional regulator n=1 Tax=Actinoplanes couchii TaxID=403638 RepID=A0ABQ3XPA2_9ACTN|nr:TetR/AcrR family transcriptional regulator [Actinoplanes couchii]MDR6315859.1 AcrR family transcriptional regulator [Actinoplanes couchii]GID60344.1 TetR family transcriptional regulator [Actinoplanes couchii]